MKALPLVIVTLLAGCSSASQIAGVVTGGVVGVASGSPAVGFAVGVVTDAGASYAFRYIARTRQGAEQDAIAQVAGELPVGTEAAWKIEHTIPIGDEQGRLRVVRAIESPLAACKEVVFSVDESKDGKLKRDWFTTSVCKQADAWKWASAEPAVERWGFSAIGRRDGVTRQDPSRCSHGTCCARLNGMRERIDTWLRLCPDPATDPLAGMREVGLLDPISDYATIACVKAAMVERTGLLGVASVWGGRQQVGRHFLAFGTDTQRSAWLGRALAVAISEPKVGAHPKLLTTRAEKTSAGYRITGEKAWVSNGPSADAIIVFAITAEHEGRKRYSAFIVPRDTRGVAMSNMPGFHALRPSQHCLLSLDGIEVPDGALLGEAGSAYERMALPFRDIEDAVGSFGTLGALRYAVALCARAADAEPLDLGAIVALNAVFAAGAEAVVATLDAGRFRTGDATLVGLRVLAQQIVDRLKPLSPPGASDILTDLQAILAIAPGPRMARQAHLGQALLRPAVQPVVS